MPERRKSGFGYTINKDKFDVDLNKCTDFAVGYPKSNSVVLLKSKEVVILRYIDYKMAIKLQPQPSRVKGKYEIVSKILILYSYCYTVV